MFHLDFRKIKFSNKYSGNKVKNTTENLIISDYATIHENKMFLMTSSVETVFLKNINSIQNITSET